MTNLDDLAVLSAPFCYADGWNANYFEIDNVPTQMIIEKLHRWFRCISNGGRCYFDV